MAIVEFGGTVTGLTGSVGGWTFQRTRAGNIVRTKPRPPISPTTEQTAAQAVFFGLIQSFQALTPGQKLAWDAFAVANPKVNRFGQSKQLTGQNWFTSINAARGRLALIQLSVPPALLLPPAITSFNLVVDAVKIEVSGITPNTPADTALFIYTTFPNTLTTNKQRSAFRFTQTVFNQPFGTINLTFLWGEVHNLLWPVSGAAECIDIGVEIVPVRKSTGITGPGIQVIGGLDFATAGIGFMEIESTFLVS